MPPRCGAYQFPLQVHRLRCGACYTISLTMRPGTIYARGDDFVRCPDCIGADALSMTDRKGVSQSMTVQQSPLWRMRVNRLTAVSLVEAA